MIDHLVGPARRDFFGEHIKGMLAMVRACRRGYDRALPAEAEECAPPPIRVRHDIVSAFDIYEDVEVGAAAEKAA